jgi:DNA-binding MarR family transcriptional regulator
VQDDRLRGSLGYALVRAFRHVNRAHNRAMQRFELSAEQAHILLLLWLGGPMKVGELQHALMLSSGTLTGAIDRMVKARLVRRVADPDDRRAWRVEPEPFDAKRRRAIESALEATQTESFAMLTATERKELLRLLKKVCAEE